MLVSILLGIHVIIACLIVVVILLQPGQGAHTGAGYGAQSLFGSRGSGNFLTRFTTILAILFFMTSLTLAHLNSKAARNGSGIIQAPLQPPVEPEKPVSEGATEVPISQ